MIVQPPTTRRPFLLMSLPRSGSTALARALNLHADLQVLVEPFNKRRYKGAFHDLAHDFPIVDVLELIRTKWPGIKHVWDSNGDPFAERPEINRQIALHGRQRVIHLVRRNALKRVVSSVLARATHFWMGAESEYRERISQTGLAPLDPGSVRRQIREDLAALSERREMLSRSKIPALEVSYESLLDDQVTASERYCRVCEIIRFLAAPMIGMGAFRERWEPVLTPAGNRINSEAIYRRIPGIERLDRDLGTDATGRLFRKGRGGEG